MHQAVPRFWDITSLCDLWTIRRISYLETDMYFLSTQSNSFTDMATVKLKGQSS